MSKLITYKEVAEQLRQAFESPSTLEQTAIVKALLDNVEIAAEAMERKTPNWAQMDKPILAIDFDGCICSQEHGWEGVDVIRGTPIQNAFQYIYAALIHFKVVIFSTRCNDPKGILAMQDWFLHYGLSQAGLDAMTFEPGKPSFFAFIDDRALNFMGDWNTLMPPEHLKDLFKPWDYKHAGWTAAQEMSKQDKPFKEAIREKDIEDTVEAYKGYHLP